MSVSQPIITQGKQQRLYGTTISILSKMGENVVLILHIHGAIAIFILFCYHQDTKYESFEIKINISQPILTYKNKSKDLWNNDIYTPQN